MKIIKNSLFFVTKLILVCMLSFVILTGCSSGGGDNGNDTPSTIQVNVPDVAGLSRTAAETAVIAANLTVGTVTTQSSDTVAAGMVISQNPAAGTAVDKGTAVDLVVSSGAEKVSVPDVTGLTQAAAEAAVISADLTVGTVTTQSSDTVAAGMVISQNPAAGTTADKGIAVDIVISSGAGSGLPPEPADVAPEIDRTVATTLYAATSFLYTGSTPVQTGMNAGTINPVRASVIRGKVMDQDSSPLSGVTITILNHPEFGQTLSRETDGMFDMAVNGGGYLTVNYEKTGYLPVQRQIDVPWQDYAHAPDVIMLPLDNAVTAIDLSSADIQVHRGTQETDTDGDRQATLLFMPGTSAELVMPDGSTQSVSTLNIRATEYTVGENGPLSMPAELPPNTAYTYAVELSADEAIAADATRVNFTQPVYFYLENFIGAPTGTAVPTGYYDRSLGQWIASENGRVIKVLDVSGGIAILDTNGDGVEDTAEILAELTITDTEREKIASLYTAGQIIWRVPLTHLTPWDCNWPYVVTPDAVGPNAGPPRAEGNGRPEDNPCTGSGSIIECQNQILGERIDIAGTASSLNYRSDRTVGNKAAYSLKIPISGESVPASLQGISMEIHLAGRIFRESFPAEPDQIYSFTWDGLDTYGRQLQGKQPYTVCISFLYPAVYAGVDTDFENSFNRVLGNLGINGEPDPYYFIVREDTMEIDIQQIYNGFIGAWDYHANDLGKWSLSIHHDYAPVEKRLYLGDGTRRSAENIQGIIDTVTGGGDIEIDDGVFAEEADIGWPNQPYDVAVDRDGSYYICSSTAVFKTDPEGMVTRIAGIKQTSGFAGDGGPATEAVLNSPDGIAVGPDGSIYIADTGNHRVRKVDPDGIIRTIAGDGSASGMTLQGLAWATHLPAPQDIALGPDGSLYISTAYRVFRVGPDNIINLVAGNGLASTIPLTPRPATETGIYPRDIAVGPDGTLYISDYLRILKVTRDGIISTVAGNGTEGFGEDGIPALETMVSDGTKGITVGSDGSVYFFDDYRIRKIDSLGIISTVAGTGSAGQTGDGGLPVNAQFAHWGRQIDTGPDGSMYIVGSDRIRKVTGTMPGYTFSDIIIPAEDGRAVYKFNSYGRHLSTLDVLTGNPIYTFTYNTSGNLIQVEDRFGRVTTIERDTEGAATAIVAHFGERTTLQNDANGYLGTVINPAGEQFQMTYTDKGLLTSMKDPAGGTSQFSYDEWGLLIRDEAPDGGFQTFERSDDGTGYTVTRTSAMGLVTTFKMEDLTTGERVSRKDYPDGTWNSTVYGVQGDQTTTYCDGTVITLMHGPDPRFGMLAPVLELMEITTPGGVTNTMTQTHDVVLTDPDDLFSLETLTNTVTVNGKTITYAYDAATKTLTETTPQGRIKQSILDEYGRVAEISMGLGLDPVVITYDAYGRIASAGQGDQSWTYAYDGNNIVSRTDADGRQLNYTYDAANRMTAMALPKGETIGFAYDPNGSLDQVTLPSLAVHTLDYTSRNQLAGYTPPNGTGESHDYDLDKARTMTTLASGRTITNNYDATGRWTGIFYPSATVSFSSGAGCGSLEAVDHTPVEGSAQSVNYAYDGRLVTGISFSGAAQGEYNYLYDTGFLISQVDVTSGSDSLSFPISRDDDDLITQYGRFTMERNGPDGSLSSIDDGTFHMDITYDTMGRVQACSYTVNSTSIYGFSLTRSNINAITQKIETVSGSTDTVVYEYDDNLQLQSVTRNSTPVETYTYDVNGNRLSTLSETATYDIQDKIITSGSTTCQFDADGYLMQRGDDQFQYSALGELLKVTMGSGDEISYTYDGHRRRVGRTDAAGTWQYLYGNPYNTFQITAMRDPDGHLTILYYDDRNMLFAMDRDGTAYYVATDHLGTPKVITDATGTAVKIMTCDGFGRMLTDSDSGFDMPIGFAGGLADSVTGLVRFGLRDYDTSTGRWTARDPVLFDGGQANLYVYVGNNPVNLRDPMGLWCIGVSGYAGVGGGVELCCDNGKCSICGEIGLGLGVSGTIGSGDAKETGSKTISEVGASCGPLGASAKCEYGYKCGAKCSAKAGVGPYNIDTSGEVGVGDSGGPGKSLNARCSAQAKLVGEYCKQF